MCGQHRADKVRPGLRLASESMVSRLLSHRQGHRSVPPRGGELAFHRFSFRGRSIPNRASGAERQREGLFFGTDRRALCRRAQGQTGDPDTEPFIPLMRRRARRGCERSTCRPRSPTDSSPISMRSTTPRWQNGAIFIASPANPQVRGLARLFTA